ncbi:MAG TPA: DUF4199 domain-containing protein [Tangfeifania sp.]|nr:DUF4199 domain-containing protein [Tangfeifania sp.]
MEQKTASIWKSSITYGVYVGILLILLSVVYYVTGNTFAKSAQWVSYALMVVGIIWAQLGYRKAFGGTLTYGQAVGVGVLTMLFASILSSIYTYLLYDVIDPSLQEQMRLFTEEQIVSRGGMPEEQMDMAIEMATRFQKPWIMAIMGVLGGVFVGLIISLITAIFTKKNPSEDIVE